MFKWNFLLQCKNEAEDADAAFTSIFLRQNAARKKVYPEKEEDLMYHMSISSVLTLYMLVRTSWYV